MTSRPAAIPPLFSPEDARMLSGLQLAYIGDTVHDLLVRTRLLYDGARVGVMHKSAAARVNATAQARALDRVLPALTEDEMALVRRGRNAHAHHAAPKAASPGDYAGATGFEALLGFLYLTGDMDRLCRLFDLSCQEDEACRQQSSV